MPVPGPATTWSAWAGSKTADSRCFSFKEARMDSIALPDIGDGLWVGSAALGRVVGYTCCEDFEVNKRDVMSGFRSDRRQTRARE